MTTLDGKTALVTGGARGIGRGIVESFLAVGARVATCGRGGRPDDLPQEVMWQQADVSRVDDVRQLCAAAGPMDILVNNAGLQIEKTTAETSDADYDLLMGVNVRGVFLLCREVIPVMTARGGGVIINIGSISGHVADPGMALYNASKAFVHGLTRSIAVDHGARGIRCNAVCPGWIMTGMADAAFALAEDPAAAKRDALARHAVGRFGAPEDIANIVTWLASDAASYVSGQTLTVDGGLTAASPLQPGLF
ncbi:MAG: SDR family oxidoreductase [Pseudomonadota bacterium]